MGRGVREAQASGLLLRLLHLTCWKVLIAKELHVCPDRIFVVSVLLSYFCCFSSTSASSLPGHRHPRAGQEIALRTTLLPVRNIPSGILRDVPATTSPNSTLSLHSLARPRISPGLRSSPRMGRFSSAVGPTFWWGGTVTDPNTRALFGQAFLEVQFYPDGVVKNCTPGGGFNLTSVPNAFSVCAPVWQVDSKTFAETAAFNAMLVDASTGSAMVMHGGDTITIHFYLTTATDGWHITVQDVTSGHQGTIILDSQYGPLQPAFSTQQIGNSLGWGIVHDTPNAFVWEIGHTSPFTHPASQFCTPGQTICDSYDAAHWAGFTPLQIKGVTFAGGSTANTWATVSDFGGSAEVNQGCSSYGGPFCIYPWFSSTGTAFNYGIDYPDTQFDYGQAAQFAPTEQCSGPLGSTYCDTVIHPGI